MSLQHYFCRKSGAGVMGLAFAILLSTIVTPALLSPSAGAVTGPGISPILSVVGTSTIQNVIQNVAPFIYAIPSGTSGDAPDWNFELNDSPASTTNDLWADHDQVVINVGPNGSVNDFTANSFVEFGGVPTVAVSGGGSRGATKPTFSAKLTTNPSDSAGDKRAALRDEFVITLTDNPVVRGSSNFSIAISNISYTVGTNFPSGVIDTAGSSYVSGSTSTPILVVPNAAVLHAYASANTPPIGVAGNSIDAPISPVTITETVPGVVQGFVCIQLSAGSFARAPTITVSKASSAGGATVVRNVATISSGTTLAAQVTAPSTTSATKFTFSNLTVDAPNATGSVTASLTIDNNGQCTSTQATSILLPGNPEQDAPSSGVLPEIPLYTSVAPLLPPRQASLGAIIARIAQGQEGVEDNPADTDCNPYSGSWGDGSPCADVGGSSYRSIEWCADFAAWVWRQAGVSFTYGSGGSDINANSNSFYYWAVAEGTWHNAGSGYTPQPGDVAVYGTSGPDAQHVGIVISNGSSRPNVVNGDWEVDYPSTFPTAVYYQTNESQEAGVPLAGYASP